MTVTISRLGKWLPHGGSLPYDEWQRRHKVISVLLLVAIAIAVTYAALARGSGALRYVPEDAALVIFAGLAWSPAGSRKWRSLSASLGLLTVAALLVDISGGLIEMHFAFFVVVLILTLYEDWVPFLVAVLFVLLHHGIMGTLDSHAVFNRPAEWADPWAWAALHALFVALAGIAGVAAWRLNEQVRGRMKATQVQLQAAHDELAALATTDPLTGLANHRAVIGVIEQEIERSRRYRRTFSILFLDLDHFKALNDTSGHRMGDDALKAVGGLLKQRLRGVDTPARWGGEEFLAILPETDREEALAAAEKLREAVAQHGFGETGMHLTCSIGVAEYPRDGADRSGLIDAADRAMYAAKSLGRNQALSAGDPAVLALGEHTSDSSRDALALAGAIEALAMLVDVRDDYTGTHASDVSRLAHAVALQLELGAGEAQLISVAARLHDVGKVAVPDAILRKQGRLTEDEWTIMRTHPVVGAEVVGLIPALRPIAPILRAHHERVDGTGYPDGLSGDEIPLGARVIAVADAYSAMVSDRPYRKALDADVALTELRANSGTQFDSAVFAAFEAILSGPEASSRTAAYAVTDR
ncbi:MAG TPA: diguanylate cyclase [Solirubrobacteraceae bacterium]|nr:diguanylate cyclase [Solirubrobacteraceae bacterium]